MMQCTGGSEDRSYAPDSPTSVPFFLTALHKLSNRVSIQFILCLTILQVLILQPQIDTLYRISLQTAVFEKEEKHNKMCCIFLSCFSKSNAGFSQNEGIKHRS